MIRATGFLVGVLLMLGLFLLTLGTGNSPTLVKEVVSSKAGASHMLTTSVPAPVPALAEAADVISDHAVDSQVLAVTDTVGPAEEHQQDAGGNGLALDPQSWNQAVAPHETDDRSDAMIMSRYRVWSPFRSEWAANGFARRLVLATDVPVEVVNESPGNYQVVFSYRDDGERQALIERIETITGLELE